MQFSIDGNKIEITNSYTYLGTQMTNTCSFAKATDIMYKKALKALFSVYSSLDVRADLKNIPLFLKLFDSLVKPVLLYGSEVWGSAILSENNPINKFTNKFYRTLLGVPRHTSNAGIHAELGRFPIHVNIQKAMIKYWFRLLTLPKDRLASHCYWSLLDCKTTTDPWLNAIKKIITSTGQYFIWEGQKALAASQKCVLRKHESYVCQTLQDVSFQTIGDNISQQTKLTLFRNSKPLNKPAKYLNLLSCRKNRTMLSKFRLGTLDLEIEKGRRHNIPREARVCKLCSSGSVEDEIHFILNCPKLDNTRNSSLTTLSANSNRFPKLTPEEKIKYLFFNENISAIDLEISSSLLCDLQETKVHILSE